MDDNVKRTWKDKAYILRPVFDPDSKTGVFRVVAISGIAVGLRSDHHKLQVGVILPTIWPANFDWIAIADQRLDTLLECACSQFGQCPSHQMLAQQWATVDLSRNVIVPDTVPEILHGIVVPKRSPIILPT
jgi:hypothetical protein